MTIQSVFVITEELRSTFGFELKAGRLPNNANEIVISKAMYDLCEGRQVSVGREGGATTTQVSKMEDIIGKMLPNSNWKVVGIIDTKLDEKWLTDFKNSLDSENNIFYDSANYGIVAYGPHFAYFTHDNSMADNDNRYGGINLQTSDRNENFWCGINVSETLPANTTLFDSSVTKLGEKQAVVSYACSFDVYPNYSDTSNGNRYYISCSFRSDGLGVESSFDLTRQESYGNDENGYATEDAANAKIPALQEKFKTWWNNNVVSNKTTISTNLSKFGVQDNDKNGDALISPTYVGVAYHFGRENTFFISSASQQSFGSDVARAVLSSGDYKSVTCTSKGGDADKKMVADLCDYNTATTTLAVQNEASGVLESFGSMLKTLTTAFLYIGIVFAIFSALLVMSYIGNSIAYKKKEIGVLRALGATGRDVYRIFTWESLIILGIVAAISLVILFGGCIAINMVMKNQLGIYVTLLVVGFRQIGLVLGVCLFIALISSFLPTRKISRMQPIDAMQERK